ncbi:hypothetical protein J6590_106943, partial [Homalodisca vitripennis]
LTMISDSTQFKEISAGDTRTYSIFEKYSVTDISLLMRHVTWPKPFPTAVVPIPPLRVRNLAANPCLVFSDNPQCFTRMLKCIQ